MEVAAAGVGDGGRRRPYIGAVAAIPHGGMILLPWPTVVCCRRPRSLQRTVGAPLPPWVMVVACQPTWRTAAVVAYSGWLTDLLKFQTVVSFCKMIKKYKKNSQGTLCRWLTPPETKYYNLRRTGTASRQRRKGG
jgi:hypothetical protein